MQFRLHHTLRLSTTEQFGAMHTYGLSRGKIPDACDAWFSCHIHVSAVSGHTSDWEMSVRFSACMRCGGNITTRTAVFKGVRDGNGSVGHGSNGSSFLDGSRGSWVTASHPLTHDEITQYHYQATYFCFPLRLALFSVLCS